MEVVTPDRFLAQKFHLNPELLEEKPRSQAAARRIPFEELPLKLSKWAPSLPKLLVQST
jgi:hypothetical protein